MTELELDSASYPPSVLASAPVGATRMRARLPGGGSAAAAPAGAGGQESSPILAAGPSGYVGTVKAAHRPRNLEEMAARVQLQDTAPWPEGTAVPVGTRGKWAHWTGAEWKRGRSPGYAPAADSVTGAAIGDEAAPVTGQAVVELEDGQQVSGTLPAEVASDPPTQELPVMPPPPWAVGTPAATPADTPGTQFPGDTGGTSEELSR